MLFLVCLFFYHWTNFIKKKIKKFIFFYFYFFGNNFDIFKIIFNYSWSYNSLLFIQKKYIQNFSFLFLIVLTLIYLLISNFLFREIIKLPQQLYNKTYVNTDRNLFFENENYVITATNYYENKIKATELILDSFFIGNGFNSFANYKNYEYPHLVGRPHSTYFGIFAEYGLIGIIFLILLFYLSLKKSLHYNESNLSLIMICIFLIIDGVNTDLLFTKIFWIFFAFISYNRIRSIV